MVERHEYDTVRLSDLDGKLRAHIWIAEEQVKETAVAQAVARKLVWSEDSYPVQNPKSTAQARSNPANAKARTSPSRRDTVDLSAGKTAPLFSGPHANLLDENMLAREFVPKLDYPELAALAQVNKAWYGLVQPKLTHMNIRNGNELSTALGSSGDAKSVDFSKYKNIGDAEIALVSARFPNLGKLVISEPGKLSNESMQSIAKLKNLRSLHLRNCLDITGDGVHAVRVLPLRQLDLSGCSNVSSNGLQELGHLSDTLTELKLSGCDGMLADGIAPLESLRKLEKLDLTWCEIPESANIAKLIEDSPQKLQVKTD